jgi:hypothetical protein
LTTKKKQIALVCLTAFIIACIVAFLAYRGKGQNAWEETKAELIAKGVEFNWEKLIPPEVPADQNFYAHPVVRELLPPKGVTPPGATNPALAMVPRPPSFARWGTTYGQPFEMSILKTSPKTIAEENPTNSVSLEQLRAWIEHGAEALAGLRDANQRPYTRLEGDYSIPFSSPMPNFIAARALAQFAASSARVHLLSGDPAAALEDLEAMQAVMRGLDLNPKALMNAAIHGTVAALYVRVVSEGVADQLWGPRELHLLADRLAEMNLIETMHLALKEGELAGGSRFFDDLAGPRNTPGRKAAVVSLTGASKLSPDGVLLRIAPDGWIRRNQAVHARLMIGFVECMDGAQRRYYAHKNAAAARNVTAAFAKWSPHNMLAAMATPNFLRAGMDTIKSQLRIDQTAIVCALEAHKMKQGSYPTALADLTPEFITKLPTDPFSGKNYLYRKVGDSFVLYSVSANEKDDGGSHGESISHQAAEDFVWAKSIEVRTR